MFTQNISQTARNLRDSFLLLAASMGGNAAINLAEETAVPKATSISRSGGAGFDSLAASSLPGSSSIAFPNEVTAEVITQKGRLTLSPKYQTQLDFGVPAEKFKATVNKIVPNVLRAVQHEPGKKALYWREKVFAAVDSEISKLDFKPNENLEKFLKAAAAESWVKSIVRYDYDIPAALKVTLSQRPNSINQITDIILGDPDPRGTCTAFSVPTLYMFQGVVNSTSFENAGLSTGLSDFVKLHDGTLSSAHSWAYLRIGDRILQSDPTFSKIPREQRNSLNEMPYWDITLAGWTPETTQKFLERHWLPFGYKDRYWNLVGANDAWTSLSLEEWKSIVTSNN